LDKNTVISLKEKFDTIVQTIEDEHVEFWYARELMTLLDMLGGKILKSQ